MCCDRSCVGGSCEGCVEACAGGVGCPRCTGFLPGHKFGELGGGRLCMGR